MDMVLAFMALKAEYATTEPSASSPSGRPRNSQMRWTEPWRSWGGRDRDRVSRGGGRPPHSPNPGWSECLFSSVSPPPSQGVGPHCSLVFGGWGRGQLSTHGELRPLGDTGVGCSSPRPHLRTSTPRPCQGEAPRPGLTPPYPPLPCPLRPLLPLPCPQSPDIAQS